jgi:phosphopantetheinyl transferase (holo-ACP synthase)
MIVGNDVVDLTDPRVLGKASDARFLERIFTEEERAAIAAARDPDMELWRSWAAKETAYKAVSKLRGSPPTFAHRAFVVSWSRLREHDGLTGLRVGSVHFESTVIDIEATWDPKTVHVIGWVGDTTHTRNAERFDHRLARLDEPAAAWSAPLTELERRLTPRELEAVHSRASLAVRIGARTAIAEALKIDEHRLEIVCPPGKPGRRPPAVLVDGEPATVDVSLSHDGDWIAWAFALERAQG